MNLRASRGANLVTLRFKFRRNETLELHRVVCPTSAAQYEYNVLKPSTPLQVERSAVRGGSVGGAGGGISLLEESSLTLRDSEVSGNSATTKGGGLYVCRSTTVVLENANFVQSNTAGGDGGGVYTTADLTLAGQGRTILQVSGVHSSSFSGIFPE